MTVETFFANFGHLADAPNGVQKLRELILQLAVQGKLVSQDGSEGWGWVRLGDVVEVLDSLRQPVTKHDRKPGPYPYYGASGIVDYVSEYIFDEPLVLVGEDGAKWGSGDKTAFKVEGKTWVNNHAHVLRPVRSEIEDQFLVYVLVGLDLQPYITGTTVPKLNQARLVSIEIPLPPLAEQKRIVAKVDQLMALCDEIEARQQKQQQARVRLNNAALDALLAAREPDEFADHWQRISTNFDLLYDNPETIAKLRAAILQLAVQGKLVPHRSVPDYHSLGSILSEASVNGVSKGPTSNSNATEVLRISAGTSRGDFYVDEKDFKHVELSRDEIEKYKLLPGDLLACRFNGNLHFVGRFSVYRGETGRVQVNPDKLIRFRINARNISRYVCYVMNSAVIRESIELLCSTTAGNIGLSAGKLKSVKIPLPPLEEQKRIVAKVDHLMSLCDEFEAKLNHARQHSERLMEATVRQLLGTAAPKRPHTARPPAKTAAPLPTRKARTSYSVAEATEIPVAAEIPATCDNGNIPEKILRQMKGGAEYSRAELLAATGIRETDWIWAIRQLKEQGKVVQTGERRGARYRVSK